MTLLFCAGCGHALTTGEAILVRADAYPDEDPPFVVERRWCERCCLHTDDEEPPPVRYPYGVSRPLDPGTVLLARLFEGGGGGDG